MTNEGGDAGRSPSPETGAGASEPVSGGYEPPPIETAQQPSTDVPPAYDPPPAYAPPPSYEAPPSYEQSAYPPPPGADAGYPPPGYPPPPQQFGAAPGYGAPPYPGTGYGAPGYGAQGYGAQGYGAPGYPPGFPAYGAPAAKTNVLAIASLVASIISLCGVGSIVGIVLGVVALNQIKVSGESGRGLAIAGIVVGAVTLLFSLVWLVGFGATSM